MSTLPNEWFDDQGVNLTDTPKGNFIHENKPTLGLFVRKSAQFTAPMAVTDKGSIYIVLGGEFKGLFKSSVQLGLQDKDGERFTLKIPAASIQRGFEKSVTEFLAWANTCSPILTRMALPDYMFARNITLQTQENGDERHQTASNDQEGFEIVEPDALYFQQRISFAKENGDHDILNDLLWIGSVKTLVTTKSMAQNHLQRIVEHIVVAESINNKELMKFAHFTQETSTPHLKKFNSLSYSKFDSSSQNITHAYNAITTQLRLISREGCALKDPTIVNWLIKDAQELYIRVSVNASLTTGKSSGLAGLIAPKAVMRHDFIKLLEEIKAIESCFIKHGQALVSTSDLN